VSKSRHKKFKSHRNTSKDFNKVERHVVRDKLKHGVYEDLPELKNHRLKGERVE
jgi:hypothetical protein